MLLAGVELEMLKTVVHRFLTMKESTPRKLLVRRFKDPDALDHLVRSAVLKTHDTENLLPMVLAFEHCGDPDIQHFAKKSLEVVMHVLQHLLDVELEKTDFTPADVEEHARQMYDTIEPETIKLGLYLVQEFSGVLGGYGSKSPWEIISLRISERIVKLRNIDSAWDDHVRQYSAYLEREGAADIDTAPEELRPHIPDVGSSASSGVLVLISHSSKDKELAQVLIELLRSGLGLLPNQIRCTSVDGYRLPAGVNTDVQLRKEIKSAGVLIGLLTPNSLSSTYVLFELGARWGAELPMIPLLAGITPEEMRGPHRVLNALSCETEGQIFQLLTDIGTDLKITPQSPESYLKQVRTMKSLADSVARAPATQNLTQGQRAAASASLRGPNMFFLNTDTVRLRLEGYEGEGFYKSDDENDPIGVIACFRNDPSSARRVIDADDVRAQIIYKGRDGKEIGNGVPRACWMGHNGDMIDFPVGQAHCAILMMVFNDGKIHVPWNERIRSSNFMGGDVLRTADYEFSKDAVTTLEIRLIGAANELLLPPLTFDFSVVKGKPRAAIKQQ